TPKGLSRIEFVPRPDPSLTNRGVTSQFAIDLYDESGNLLASIPVTPITANNTVQSVDVPGGALGAALVLVEDGGVVKRWDDTLGAWQTVGTAPPTEQDFDTYGINIAAVPAAAWNDPSLQDPKLWVRMFTADYPAGYVVGVPTPRLVFPT